MNHLTWLPNSLLKGITPPKIVFEEFKGQPYSGYFLHATQKITVVEGYTEASTIAHEFCHYLQHLKGNIVASTWKVEGTYEESIHKYFTTNKSEYEALRFEYKYAKDYLNEWWLRKLVHGN